MVEARQKAGLDLGWAKPLERITPIGFGADHARPVDAAVVMGPEDHSLTFAPTGAGKGTTSIMPLLLSHDGPAIVFDPKGEAAHVTADWRRSQGHQVFVIDPMSVTGLPKGRFNPLDLIDLGRADAYDEARALADCLLLERGDPKNSFWLNQARQLLTAAILQAVADAGGVGKASISDLVRLCDRLPPGPFNWLRDSTLPEVEAIAGMIDLGAPETLGGMLHFVMEAVETLRSRPVQNALGRSSFSLSDLIEGQPMTVYFVLPPHMLRSHARLIRFWFGALIQTMARRARSPAKPTLFVIDEAAQLGRLEAFVTLMTLMRGYGVQCASFWQDPAQMIATYPDDWQSLRNNAGLITAFGQTGRAAMRDLERYLGYPEGQLDPWAGQRLCQSGGTLMRAETRDYRHDPILKARARPNPFHEVGRGPIERAAPKSAVVRPTRPNRDACRDQPSDRATQRLDEELLNLFDAPGTVADDANEKVPF